MDTALELSIVIPTFNESGNIVEMIRRLDQSLRGIAWEVVFVDDDSPDRSSALVRKLAQADRRIRCIQRIGRRGLSSACIEGMLATSAPFLAVMDGDLQHDETRLPKMLSELRAGSAELALGTRYAEGGGIGSWEGSRASMSRWATRISRVVCKQTVSDPMSGFFMLRRELIERTAPDLSGMGFKILLDILATSSAPVAVVEVPYHFGSRLAGESKLDSNVVWEYGMLLADKLVGKYVPVRFLSFSLVGAGGILVHMSILALLLRGGAASFRISQGTATLVAMVFNFAVNNVLTYRDMRLRGWRWLRGAVTFILACSLGAFANVGVASYLFERRTEWFIAGLAGIAVGAVWNYVVTMFYTWGKRSRFA